MEWERGGGGRWRGVVGYREGRGGEVWARLGVTIVVVPALIMGGCYSQVAICTGHCLGEV